MSREEVERGSGGGAVKVWLLALSWVLSSLCGVVAGGALERRRAAPPWVVAKVDLSALIGELARSEAVLPGRDTAAKRRRAEHLGRLLREELARMAHAAPERVLVLRASAVLAGAEDRTGELRRRALRSTPGQPP